MLLASAAAETLPNFFLAISDFLDGNCGRHLWPATKHRHELKDTWLQALEKAFP
jgi:hypothetical protein